MTLEPLLTATPAIQIHVLAVIPAALLGPGIFMARKGTRLHRTLGKVWLVLMVIAAASSFFIHEIRIWGDFSPIHLISIFVIGSAFRAIAAARRHDIGRHMAAVSSMYVGGILVAGLFTLLPNRIMGHVVFGVLDPEAAQMTAYAIFATAVLVVCAYLVTRRRVYRDGRAD